MKRPDDDKTLAALRELPAEVSLEQVGHMVAAFPIAVGLAALLTTIKIHLNTILMTSSAALILGGSVYVLTTTSTAARTDAPRMEAPATVLELPIEEAKAEPAVVLEMPAPKRVRQASIEPPVLACTVRTEATTDPVLGSDQPSQDVSIIASTDPIPQLEPADGLAAVGHSQHGNERTFDLNGFTGVDLHGSMDITLEQGDFAVSASGDQSQLDRLQLTVDNGHLRIAMDIGRGSTQQNCNGSLHLTVRMPKLRELVVHGSGTIESGRFDQTEELDLSVLGSGDIMLDGIGQAGTMRIVLTGSGDIVCRNAVVTGDTQVDLSGSGDVRVEGSTKDIDVKILGSGDVHAGDLRAKSGKVRITGSGDAYVNCDGSLSTNVNGSGSVHSSGSADDDRP